MIKVFHSPRSRSLRVIWMLEEMGLPYAVRPVDFPPSSPPTGAAAIRR